MNGLTELNESIGLSGLIEDGYAPHLTYLNHLTQLAVGGGI
jgi:hypothetical protein